MRPSKLIFAVLMFGGGVTLVGWHTLSEVDPVAPPATAQVSIGNVSLTVLASGMLEAAELISVGARVSGQVDTLAVSIGQYVKVGELIAQIDFQDQQNEVTMAEAALARVDAQIAAKEAELEQAERAYKRHSSLSERQYSSVERIETAATDVQVHKANLDALRADKLAAEVELSTALIALERTRITAPISGTVVAVVVEQGQTVNANTDAPTIVKLADLSTMLVRAEISEVDVASVQPGQKATFSTLGDSGRIFDAVLREIEPAPRQIKESDSIDPEDAIYYVGLLEVGNADGALRIGMTAQITIERTQVQNVLIVPSAALRGVPGARFVLIHNPATGAATRREVKVGLDNKVDAEIVSGLALGESVVVGTSEMPGAPDASERRGWPMRF